MDRDGSWSDLEEVPRQLQILGTHLEDGHGEVPYVLLTNRVGSHPIVHTDAIPFAD